MALVIYSATLTAAIILSIAHFSSFAVKAVIAFGVAATLVWSAGPILLRLFDRRRH
ncbi:MAG: hypothetical protein QOI42_1700 [Frankiaceae bacterium]|nr:hypothetical protein [Frankiaceae bacterium]